MMEKLNNTTKKLISKIKYTDNLFILICILFIFAAIIYIMVNQGYPLATLRWNSNTSGLFPDFFETIKDAKYLRPYVGLSVYPPLTYLLFYPLSNLIIADSSVWNQNPYIYNWTSMTVTQNAVILGFVFFSIITIAIILMALKKINCNTKKSFLISIIYILSPGFIFMIDRGNIVILAVLFLFVYLYLYDSNKKINKEISLISLAIAFCLKIYPAIFGILLLIDKRFKDAIKCIIYALILFLIPFMFTGGVKTVPKFVNNIIALNEDYKTNERNFGYGYKINTSNFIDATSKYITGENADQTIINVITVLIFLIIIFIVIFSKQRWMIIMSLTIAMMILPGFSYIYTAVYLIIPLAYYLKNNNIINKQNIFYTLLFVLIFSPFPYGYIMKSLPGDNKISISTLIMEISLLMFLVIMMYNTIISMKKNKHA